MKIRAGVVVEGCWVIYGLSCHLCCRTTGTNKSQTAVTDNTATGLQQDAALPIPGAVSTAPFLQHATLTPAQREYLYNIAASHSDTHVRGLITQHYMNVLHRCTPSGGSCSVARADGPGVVHGDGTQAEVCPGAKVKKKKATPKRADRSSPSSRPSNASTRRKKSSPATQRATVRLLEDEEEELDDSLGLLGITGWDDACSENIQ